MISAFPGIVRISRHQRSKASDKNWLAVQMGEEHFVDASEFPIALVGDKERIELWLNDIGSAPQQLSA